MTDRPSCYPSPATAPLPLLDVLTSPVPSGRFDSPVDERHVLCLHLGGPVPVSYRAGKAERQGVRLHGQFCVVPGGSSTRWTLAQPATSLLLRLAPAHLRATADDMGRGARAFDLAPAIHVRDNRRLDEEPLRSAALAAMNDPSLGCADLDVGQNLLVRMAIDDRPHRGR